MNCRHCGSPLVWRPPTDRMQIDLAVSCDCRSMRFTRHDLGPRVLSDTDLTLRERQLGKPTRREITQSWGPEALDWIDRMAGTDVVRRYPIPG